MDRMRLSGGTEQKTINYKRSKLEKSDNMNNDWHYNAAKANGAADHIVRKDK